jgi:hypothetical protein
VVETNRPIQDALGKIRRGAGVSTPMLIAAE